MIYSTFLKKTFMFDMSHEKSEITQMKLLYIIKIYNNLKAIMKMIFKIT